MPGGKFWTIWNARVFTGDLEIIENREERAMTTPRSRCLNGAVLSSLVFAFVFLAIPAAWAGTLYSTGFENPPFTLGPLAGQDGWQVFGNANVLVENTIVQSGMQAVSVDGSVVGQSGPYHNDFSTGPLIELSAGIYIASSSSQSQWQFAGLGSGLTP